MYTLTCRHEQRTPWITLDYRSHTVKNHTWDFLGDVPEEDNEHVIFCSHCCQQCPVVPTESTGEERQLCDAVYRRVYIGQHDCRCHVWRHVRACQLTDSPHHIEVAQSICRSHHHFAKDVIRQSPNDSTYLVRLFSRSLFGGGKVQTPVAHLLEPLVVEPNTYALQAAIVHIGASAKGGHYVLFWKESDASIRLFDDRHVTLLNHGFDQIDHLVENISVGLFKKI